MGEKSCYAAASKICTTLARVLRKAKIELSLAKIFFLGKDTFK